MICPWIWDGSLPGLIVKIPSSQSGVQEWHQGFALCIWTFPIAYITDNYGSFGKTLENDWESWKQWTNWIVPTGPIGQTVGFPNRIWNWHQKTIYWWLWTFDPHLLVCCYAAISWVFWNVLIPLFSCGNDVLLAYMSNNSIPRFWQNLLHWIWGSNMCEKTTYFADSAIQNQLVHSMHLYIFHEWLQLAPTYNTYGWCKRNSRAHYMPLKEIPIIQRGPSALASLAILITFFSYPHRCPL